jgi:amidase
MRLLSRSAIEAGQQFDAILTPALAQPPAAVGGLRDELDPAADFAAQKAFTPFTSPYNVSGQPALSFPMSWTAAGLPIGVQLVARPRDEYTIISLAAQMERAADGRPTHDLW